MSTLSQSEREGLEDVFLSIHSNQSNFEKIKAYYYPQNLLKQAKYGLKSTNISTITAYFNQKKNSLSK